MDPNAPAPTSPTPSTPAAAPASRKGDSFDTAIAAKLDAALAAGELGGAPKATVAEPAAPAAPPVEPAASAASAPEEGGLPSAAPTPPSTIVAPPEPDSDEALDREIDTTTKGWEKAQREAFAKKTYKLRELNRQNKELLAKLEDSSKTGDRPDPEVFKKTLSELETLRGQIADYESRIALVDVKQTSEWKTKVQQPKAQIDAFVEKLSARYQVPVGELREALAATGDDRGDKLTAVAASMGEYDRTLFFQAAVRQEQISAVEAELQQNATASLERITAAERAQQEAAARMSKEEWDRALPKAWDRVVELSGVLAEAEGADDWNEAVAKAKSFATQVRYSDLGVVEQAEVMHRAAAFPLVNATVKALEQEVSALREELKKYDAASPGAGGGRATVAAPTGGLPPGSDKLSFEEAVSAKLKAAGLG